MDEADKLCDRIAIIDHGKIVAMDTPENLKHDVGGDVVTNDVLTGVSSSRLNSNSSNSSSRPNSLTAR